MHPDVLAGPRLKTEWAEAHIAELHDFLRSLPWNDFCRLSVEEDLEKRRDRIVLKIIRPIPPEVSLWIGDAIHNLRSALDHLVVGLVASVTGKVSETIYFPFGTDRQNIIGSGRAKIIQEKLPDVFDLILDTIKPYDPNNGGNKFLWGLNQLDRADKHRLIIPAVSIVSVSGINAVTDEGGRIVQLTLGVCEGEVLSPFGVDNKIHIKGYDNPRFAVVFGQADAFQGQSVVPTLIDLLKATTDVIEALEAHLFGQDANR